jgi:hypothetical protein
MKNRLKAWIPIIGIIGVILGRIVNKLLSSYFGDNSSNVVVAISVAIAFVVILLAIAMAQYFIVIMMFIMTIPLTISGIGLYLNNMYLMVGGIVSIFIIYPILIKIIPKLRRDN